MRYGRHYYRPLTETGRKIFKLVGGLFLGLAGILFLADVFCVIKWLSDSDYDVAALVLGFICLVFSFLGSIFMIIGIYRNPPEDSFLSGRR